MVGGAGAAPLSEHAAAGTACVRRESDAEPPGAAARPSILDGAPDPHPDYGERRLIWEATIAGGASMAVTVAAGLGRTKLVAAALGPAALGLLGQQASLTVLLSYLVTFGTAGGTTRLLRVALAAGDRVQASRVLWTSAVLKAVTCVLLGGALLLLTTPLEHLTFGTTVRAGWIRWVVVALPFTALSAVAMATLRAERLATRHSVAQAAGAIVSVLLVAALVWRGDPDAVRAVPALVALSLAVAMAAAAAPRMAACWRTQGRAFDASLALRLATYGLAQVAMAATGAVATVIVGRTLLTTANAATAGHFYALALGGDALLALLLGGYHTHYFPSLCSASTGREASVLLGRIVRTVSLCALPVVIAGTLAAPAGVRLLLSEHFLPVVPLVGVVLLGVYLRTVTAVLGIPFLVRERLGLAVGLHLSWAVSLVATFFWLGPEEGPASWAFAFAGATAAHVAVLMVALWQILDIRVGARAMLMVGAGATALLTLHLR